MSIEKQGVVREGVTPPENSNDAAVKTSIDKLADDHTISRLIQKMGQARRPVFKPQVGG